MTTVRENASLLLSEMVVELDGLGMPILLTTAVDIHITTGLWCCAKVIDNVTDMLALDLPDVIITG